uniref:Beta-defensin-like domain-containing protein n=1 Tax=Pelusios castaneus TaxID=367368 RepID=A0A8C8RQU5_9SAUR
MQSHYHAVRMKIKTLLLCAGLTYRTSGGRQCLRAGGLCFPGGCPPFTREIGRCRSWSPCCKVSSGFLHGDITV